MKLILSATTIFAAVLLALDASAFISKQTENAAKQLGAFNVGEIEFQAGGDGIAEPSRDEIKRLLREARAAGTIDHIKVLAWSDQEYPMPKQKHSAREIKLADQRLARAKTFLQSDLKVNSVKEYNMAQRPNAFEELMRLPEANVKNTTENNGAAPKTQMELGLFGEKGQASKAVVMVFLKKK